MDSFTLELPQETESLFMLLREPRNSRDKWITFIAMLLESWQPQSYFPYTVELKLRDREVYCIL
jgi:hypothetical protein